MSERPAPAAPVWHEDQLGVQWQATATRVAWWRLAGFVALATAWVVPSLFVWFLLVTSLGGWSGEGGGFDGLLEGSAEALGTFVVTVFLELTAAVVLVGIARWALGGWRSAWLVGLAATLWAQVFATLWLVVA